MRIICDGGEAFDEIPAGYKGPRTPRWCRVLSGDRLRLGSTLAQLRVFDDDIGVPDGRSPHCSRVDRP